MKVSINIKNDSDLHSHQTLNKRIGLMKRERQYNAAHRFSFGERFDETMMKCYFISCQHIRLFHHQFIGFSVLIKSAVGTIAQSLPVCRCADRQSCRHNSTEYHTRLAKRERQKQAADTAAGFWGTKSHRLIRAFPSRNASLILKTP